MHTKEGKSCDELKKEIYKKKLENWNIQINPKYDSKLYKFTELSNQNY